MSKRWNSPSAAIGGGDMIETIRLWQRAASETDRILGNVYGKSTETRN